MSSFNLDTKQILRLATLTEKLPDSIKDFYAKNFDLKTRRARAKEHISEISIGLIPAVSVLELRNPYAADLLKQRLAVMERDTLNCCEQDIPEFTPSQGFPKPKSEGSKNAAALLVFCLNFAVWLRTLASEFAPELGNPKKKTPKSRPAHRPPDTDATLDAKIADAWLRGWKSGKYRCYRELDLDLKHHEGTVKAATDRDRKRRPEVWAANKRLPRRNRPVK